MSVIKWIIIIVLIIVAFAHFFPDKYDETRGNLTDKLKNKANDKVADGFQKISDISKDPKDFVCKYDTDCYTFLGIDGLSCENKKCVVD